MARILVVDDNAVNRELLVTLLGYGGHSLWEAADGAEALASVSAEHPDLVITDILMPTMDGYEFVRRLRATPEIAGTPVIFYTAFYREDDALNLARTCGVEHVLTKPTDPEVLLQTVNACLGSAPQSHASTVPEAFDREHLRLLTDRLSKESAKLASVNLRLEALIEIGLQLASTRHSRLLHEFCNSARQLISSKFVLAGIASGGQENGPFLVASGVDLGTYPVLNRPEQAYSTVAGLLKSGSPVRIINSGGVPGALGFGPEYPSFESILVAPILSLRAPYGWLCLFHRLGAAEFSDEDQRLAGILGGLVGRIYENGRMYAAAQQQAADLKQEVAERARAEAVARQASVRLSIALQASRTGVWTHEVPANRITWDDSTRQILGLPPGSGESGFEDFLSGIFLEDRDVVTGALRQASEEQPEFEINFRVTWQDGSVHHVASRGKSFFDNSGGLIRMMGVCQDITQDRLLEEQFRQAQKMEAVGQLAAGIAHDFNNVLTVIIGHCDVLLAKLNPRDTAARPLTEIRGAGERAAALTRQLLAFSRKQVLQPRVVNLAATFRDMDRMLGRLLGENIEIVTAIDKDLGQVKIDPTQIQQVIMNLAVNARDAMPQGGKLTLELQNEEVNGSYAGGHREVASGRYVVLAVSDNGIGMSPEVRDRVFEPFFTTKETGHGTGLGLATVYGIVKQSGGYLWLYSEPGVGTTFKILLPRVDEPPEALPSPGLVESVGGSETILLVEDDSEVRSLLETMLSSAGYEVMCAEDGIEALNISSQYAGMIDLLITDVILPKMGGKEIAEQLTALRPRMKVLFISGYTGQALIHQETLGPKVDFLQKPFSMDALHAKVRRILDPPPSLQHILVIDDEPSIRDLLAAILAEYGFKVETAGTGEEARAKALQQPLDLVITDLAMPDEDGIEIICSLRKHFPLLKIIAMSGVFSAEIFDAARLLGADATLAKPVTADTLLRCVRRLLASRGD